MLNVCRSSFEYTSKRINNAVVTSDGLFLILSASTEKNAEVLSMYHAKTGTKMYDMTPKIPNYKVIIW